MIWRGPRGGKAAIGLCKKHPRYHPKKAICEDCRTTPVEKTWTLHFTACKKPWTCPAPKEKQNEHHRMEKGLVDLDMCYQHHSEWFKLRREFDALLSSATGNAKLLSQNVGSYKNESFHRYCHSEGGYIPIKLTDSDFDIHKLYHYDVETK